MENFIDLVWMSVELRGMVCLKFMSKTALFLYRRSRLALNVRTQLFGSHRLTLTTKSMFQFSSFWLIF